MTVMNVEKPFQLAVIFKYIKELIQERNPMIATSVVKHLHVAVIYYYTRELIQERNPIIA